MEDDVFQAMMEDLEERRKRRRIALVTVYDLKGGTVLRMPMPCFKKNDKQIYKFDEKGFIFCKLNGWARSSGVFTKISEIEEGDVFLDGERLPVAFDCSEPGATLEFFHKITDGQKIVTGTASTLVDSDHKSVVHIRLKDVRENLSVKKTVKGIISIPLFTP